MSEILVEIGDPRDPQATALLQASHALMVSLFPSESNHFLSIDELCVPSIRFLVAREGDTICGCGAMKIKDGYGEVKSMFTDPAFRGRGIADLVLSKIEETAAADNIPSLKLETGDSLKSAHRLYARHGFELCGPFGDYVDDPRSIFMEKRLD